MGPHVRNKLYLGDIRYSPTDTGMGRSPEKRGPVYSYPSFPGSMAAALLPSKVFASWEGSNLPGDNVDVSASEVRGVRPSLVTTGPNLS